MHELSVCDAIVGTTLKRAEGRRVTQVTVQIGHLRQVDPETLEFYFEFVARGTVCEGARLDQEVVDEGRARVRARCGTMADGLCPEAGVSRRVRATRPGSERWRRVATRTARRCRVRMDGSGSERCCCRGIWRTSIRMCGT